MVTDNARLEALSDSAPTFFNHNAGEDILRYVRGHGLDRIPILVYTFRSIRYTTYVKDFKLAGSTIDRNVVHNYIKDFKTGGHDMMASAKFRA